VGGRNEIADGRERVAAVGGRNESVGGGEIFW
jgi:hypothetical protein